MSGETWARTHARENPGHQTREALEDPGSCSDRRERSPIYELATPAPVPSEVAESTAGEREVEALLEVILAASPGTPTLTCRRIAEAIRASPLLDRVRREEGERVLASAAFNIAHTKGGEILGRYDAMRWLTSRAASVGRGEGL